MNLPSGTVTFLFTDIEGSTRLWEEHPEAMSLALARHDALMRQAIEQHGGHVFKTIGDAFCAAFHTAPEALHAALLAQQTLHSEPWPEGVTIKARIALHTGAAEIREDDYFGPPLNRVARLLAAGHGGQALLSLPTEELTRDALPPAVELLSLGEHRLRDLNRPEMVFQLLHPALPADFAPLKSLEHLPNNLPRQLTSFIGREKETEEIKTLLTRTSLLTLTGSGGCGKTRLSLQVAADALDQYLDGVWLVELAPLADPVLVGQTVALVLGLSEQVGKTFVQALTESLKSKHLLLVLDNCEHLLSACAQLCNALLRACPRLTILASSREGLGIAGEQTYRVPSLSLPDPKQPMTLEQVSQYEAVRLFIERAVSSKADFAVTNASAPALAAVCHRLDGIPLAIELAAARVRSLSIEEINSRLDNRFRLLTGGSKTALPRQQTLRALIDWSYSLLTEAEKRLLCRLSVFAGGWTLAAAEQVCAGESEAGATIEEWEALDLLTSLVDKSLVVAETQGQGTRYRLLETVRQYGRERLLDQGEGAAVQGRHRDYFLAWAEATEPKLTGAEQAFWLEALETEHDNLRQALALCLETAEGGEAGLRLGAALYRFWDVRGHYGEGRAYLAAVLERAVGSEAQQVRALALNAAGSLAFRQGDYVAARALMEESLTIRREMEDRNGIAASLGNMGTVALRQGDYIAARSLVEEGLTIFRELGGKLGIANSLSSLGNLAWEQGDYVASRALHEESLTIFREVGGKIGIAYSLMNLGNVAYSQSDYVAAHALYEGGLSLFRELGNTSGIANSLMNLGNVATRQGDYVVSRALYEESLTISRESGGKLSIAACLDTFAQLAYQEQHVALAAPLWGAATALRDGIGSPRSPRDQEQFDRGVAAVRSALGEAAFDAAFAEGRALTMEEAIAYALNRPDVSPPG